MNARRVKPIPDPRQLEFDFSPRAKSLKDYADILTKAIIYGHSFVDFRGRVYSDDFARATLHGARAEMIIVNDVEEPDRAAEQRTMLRLVRTAAMSQEFRI
jgi:hypothetical protein